MVVFPLSSVRFPGCTLDDMGYVKSQESSSLLLLCMLRERLERRPAVRGRGERAEAMAKAMDKPRDTKGKGTGGC